MLYIIQVHVLVPVGPGTGVPFHIHGPTFAETIFGRKVHTSTCILLCPACIVTNNHVHIPCVNTVFFALI